ncbi:hypothetical protein KKF34_05670 [Myxococcota bacterium]|nr:hypothetical protein [Myxococcota bacterium]MBU1382296.1 hypothetical protein [Myxococcota bacterium]MBU1496350.1 hypothetical protein [Myxococcota bacterium]
MNSHSAHFYDIDEAVSLAKKLTSQGKAAIIGSDEPAPYVEFGSEFLKIEIEKFKNAKFSSDVPLKNVSVKDEETNTLATPSLRHIESEPEDFSKVSFDSWEKCLKWCNHVMGSSASFVIDSQGFIIGNYGRIPQEGLDGLGAELCYAIEMLDKISPGTGKLSWVDLEYEKMRIVGFQIPEEETYILGFISPGQTYFSKKIVVSQVVIRNLPDMG